MNWGFCGFGHIAKKFCTALLSVENQKIVAVATKSKSQDVDKWVGKCKVYNDYTLLAEDNEVDVVYINTTHNFHVEHIALFASRGKHIICEKPIFIHPDEVGSIRNYIDKVFIMEALWTRFLPSYRFVKQVIEEGRIGQIKWADINFAFDNSDNPKERLHKLELAGGALLDIGIYPVQLVLDLMNHQKPDKIEASATLNEHKVDITTAMILHWKKNDFYSQLFCSVDRQGSNKAVIYGKHGSITMNLFWMCEEVIVNIDGKEEKFSFPHRTNGYECQIEEVVKCIGENKKQSSIMPLNHSIDIITILGEIKTMIGYGL